MNTKECEEISLSATSPLSTPDSQSDLVKAERGFFSNGETPLSLALNFFDEVANTL